MTAEEEKELTHILLHVGDQNLDEIEANLSAVIESSQDALYLVDIELIRRRNRAVH